MKAMFEKTYDINGKKITAYTNGGDLDDCLANLFFKDEFGNDWDPKSMNVDMGIRIMDDLTEHLNTMPDVDPDDFIPHDE